jgi:hypothetical protein
VSGRLEQLARQIRKLRSDAADGRTLQRALHLALDLAAEHCDGEDESEVSAGFAALAAKGMLDGAVAQRLGALSGKRLSDGDVTPDAVIDLDVFLRSIEIGAPAQRLPLPPLGSPPKLPPGTQKAAVNVSGRVITLVGRDGRAFVLCDEKPIGQPFDLHSVPMGGAELDRDADGSVRIEWPGLRLVVGPDFASVRPELP